ncbi:MAG TPA: hypothetical protein VNS63_15560 [Blastocatellia bacterium]|nr:hypothetical protein [Blastocatellia bacterium]
MTKCVMTLLTLVVVTVSAYSQTPSNSRCSLTATNAPTVRGLHLGMSTDELLALFPGSAKRKDVKDAIAKAKAGASGDVLYLSFNPAVDSGKEQFNGVDSVGAGLVKGRVTDLSVVYVGATWPNIDAWVAKLSEAFKLPSPQDWMVGSSENPNKILRCDGIDIEAAIQSGSASIILRTAETHGSDNAAEEKKRRDIKP